MRPDRPVDYAVAYAEQGWPVLPVRTNVKAPLIKTGPSHRAASTDVDEIRSWWRSWPWARVGLRTGVVFDVLDFDDPNTSEPHDPAPWWRNLDDGSGPIARTVRGVHLYSRPADRSRWGAAVNHAPLLNHDSHIDARGLGSFVIAPTTGTDGRFWLPGRGPDQPLPQHPVFDVVTPGELAQITGKPPSTIQSRSAPPTPAGTTDETSRYGWAILRRACGEIATAPAGTRHHVILRRSTLVGSWVGGGEIARDDAVAALETAARACGHEAACSRRTIADGLAHGASTPRTKESA